MPTLTNLHRLYRTGLGLTLALALLAAPGAALAIVEGDSSAASRADEPPASGRVIVKLKPGADVEAVQRRVARAHGLGAARRFSSPVLRRGRIAGAARARGLDRLEIVDALEGKSAAETAADYAGDPDVEYAEPDVLVRIQETRPNDPKYTQLWGMRAIAAPLAWDVVRGDPGLVVAVIDTGIDYAHPDLAANVWTNPGEIPGNGFDDDDNGFVDDVHGYDFANDDGDPIDDHGHGTHVAGTIGAVGGNGVGVVGVAWQLQMMALKFIGSDGSGSSSDAVRAIHYAIQMGARLSSNSWGGFGYSQALADAVAAAQEAGQLFVVAAGNSAVDIGVRPFYPAGYPFDNVLAVGALDKRGARASFSNFGAAVQAWAPGVGVLSTTPTYDVPRFSSNYDSLSGTSMATPHVAGVAALLWARDPDLSYEEVRARIVASGSPVDAIDAASALGGLGIAGDAVPPAAIGDLRVTGSTHRTVSLAWSDTGDDGEDGLPLIYDVRYARSPITEATWANAARATHEPRPGTAATEVLAIDGLDQGTTYYFAVRARDDSANDSPLSNVVVATTTALVPATMALASGDEQVGPAESTLARPLAVVIKDAAGVGVSAIPVAFAIAEGAPGGYLTPEVAWTDVDGVARSSLTLGALPARSGGAVHRIVASTAGMPSIEFRAAAHPIVDLRPVWEAPLDPDLFLAGAAAGDTDGDGRLEVLTFGSRTLSGVEMHLYEASGDDAYAELWSVRFPVDGQIVATFADLDGDGADEVIAAATPLSYPGPPTYQPHIYSRRGGSFVEMSHAIAIPTLSDLPGDELIAQHNVPFRILVADFDQDGARDVAIVYAWTGGSTIFSVVDVWRHVGPPGQLGFAKTWTSGAVPELVARGRWTVGDSDRDGRLEIVASQLEYVAPGSTHDVRFEFNELTGGFDRKRGFDLQRILIDNYALSITPLVADLDGDGVDEVVLPGEYGCSYIVIIVGDNDYEPQPGDCPAGNIAVFRATGDETFEPVWSNQGAITPNFFVYRQLDSAVVGQLNALPLGRRVVVAGGSRDVEAGIAYAVNPFPFPDDYLLPLWTLPDAAAARASMEAIGDFDGDTRPDLATLQARDKREKSRLVILEEHLELGGENQPPQLQPIGPKAVGVGGHLVFAAKATDLDRDILTYWATGLPAGAEFDPVRRQLAWMPTAEQAGYHTVRISVSDG